MQEREKKNKKKEGFCRSITRGFDDPVLVGFGGIAMPFAVRESLDHFRALSLPSADLLMKKTESKGELRERKRKNI